MTIDCGPMSMANGLSLRTCAVCNRYDEALGLSKQLMSEVSAFVSCLTPDGFGSR